MSRVYGICVFLLLLVAACSSGAHSEARADYNHGLKMMAEGNLSLAESSLMDARSNARGDQLLRYSAAFNLGVLHARKAEEVAESAPQDALAELQKSRSWFQDAASVRSDDVDARENLEIVGRRIQVLADQLNKGKNGLEARLSRLIEDERGARDGVRKLMEAVQAANAEADPIGFRDAFFALATRERELMAEAGTVSDLAADELALLDAKAEEALTQEDRVRKQQLQGLASYLSPARVAMDDSRRALRALNGKASHAGATMALSKLKRAREQLMDPVTVLKAVANDQQELLSHTVARLQLTQKELQVDHSKEKTASAQAPAWLEPEHLAQRQRDSQERTQDILARFQAAANAPAPAEPAEAPDPKTERMVKMASQAAPFLQTAVTAMESANGALLDDKLDEAQLREGEALRQLLRAIEHFSDLRNLIELTYAEHLGVVAMLDPNAPKEAVPKEMSTKERAEASVKASERNADRLERMILLIQEQRDEAKAQAAQEAGGQAEAEPSSAEQPFVLAEQFRSAAATKLTALLESLSTISGGARLPKGVDPLSQAQLVTKDLEELRRIFYSIVEHLKELHGEQSETYDATGTAQAAEDEGRTAALPSLAERQTKHATMGEALASALEKQADTTAASQQENAAQESEKFANAAVEVRKALESMNSAKDTLSQANADAASMSVDLSAALEEQPLAIEHIAAAIAILEPPKEEPPDEGDENQEQDEQQQQEQEQEEEVSEQQADRQLQEIRDREAARQRDKERGKAPQGGAVDKDW